MNSSSSRRMPRLPAGFRFHPTDEELVVHYLTKQASSSSSGACPAPPIIAEVNIYRCNPWELPRQALFGDREWYFFSPRDRKYPNGARPNRAAGEGYWKATGTDKAVGVDLAVKKALVFYRGKPPRGVKTDWVMHEYRLTTTTTGVTERRAAGSSSSSSSSSMRLDDWVLCRIYKKSNDFQVQFASHDDLHDNGSTTVLEEGGGGEGDMNKNNGDGGGALAPPSPTKQPQEHGGQGHHQYCFPPPANSMMSKSCSLTDLLSTIDYSTLSQLLLDAPPPLAADTDETTQQQQQHQSPLIIHSTTTPPPLATQPLITNNNNNVINSNTTCNATTTINDMPRGDGDASLLLCSSEYGYGAGYNSNNNSLKRKRVMTTTTTDGSSLFDDGAGNLKRKLLLPSSGASARTISSSGLFYGGNSTQHLAEAGTGSSSSFIQCSGGLHPAGHNNNPFLVKNEQLLLYNHHLQMQ